MARTTFRIALANLPFPSSPDDAVERAVAAVHEAGGAQADLVAFPECYIPGYRISSHTVPLPTPQYLERAWTAVANAARAANVGVVLGTERFVDDGMRISVLVINRDGTVAGFQDKVQLDPSEDALYAPGTSRRVFTAGDLTFGVAICHEGWRYPETVRFAAREGAHLVFLPHFGEAEPGAFRPAMFADPANTFHEKAIQCRAAENTCFVAAVNCAGDGSPTTSAVARPDGTVLAWQPYGAAGLLVVDIDTSEATRLLASRLRPATA
jgi:predicted amidohydrolase